MAEQYYVFIKNNVVEQIAVFASKDEELADRVAHEQGFDDATWVGEDKPDLYSFYDGEKFIKPTEEYLYERGVITETNAMIEARRATEQTTTPTE